MYSQYGQGFYSGFGQTGTGFSGDFSQTGTGFSSMVGGKRRKAKKAHCKKNRSKNRCVLSTRKTDSRLCRRTAKNRCAVAKPTVAPAYQNKPGLSAKAQAEARKAHNSRMRRAVYKGTYKKTRGGLMKKDLVRSTVSGKIVSKKQSAHGRRMFAQNKPNMNRPYGPNPNP